MIHSQLSTNQSRREPLKTADSGRELVDEVSTVPALAERQSKSSKGSVVVNVDKSYLRLRWSWGGRRYVFSLGLLDSKINRVVAERKAKLIERDILTEQFDPTLEKYRLQVDNESLIAVVVLFEQFIEFKQKQVDSRTLQKYWGLLTHLKQFFRQKKALHVSEDDAISFRDWLLKKLAAVTVKERLGLLRACWNWAEKRGKLKGNPWEEVNLKVPPKQKPKPFTVNETKRILEGFKRDPTYRCYTDFAEFLLATGCRIGEAIGLQWQHLSEDCQVLWIGESFGRGVRKATKTNTARTFELSPRIQQILVSRRPENWKPNDLVFTSPTGKAIDDHNFRNRAWKPILERVGVPYRKPRNSRHSFVSQAIASGMMPTEVSEITGHSVQTLYKHYLGGVNGRAKLPDLLGD
jgi:integrase